MKDRDVNARMKDAEAFRGRVGASDEACAHQRFECRVDVGRMSDAEDGPITGYTADIQVKCGQCGLAFRFVGLPAGTHYAEPRVSSDGLELRAPIEPATHEKFQTSASYIMPPKVRQ